MLQGHFGTVCPRFINHFATEAEDFPIHYQWILLIELLDFEIFLLKYFCFCTEPRRQDRTFIITFLGLRICTNI